MPTRKNSWQKPLGLTGRILCAALIAATIAGCDRFLQAGKSRKATEATNRGLAHMKENDFQAAIKDFTEALANDPNDAVIYFNRGLANSEAGLQKEAIADFSTALEKKKDYVPALVERSHAYVANQQYKKAQADVERVKKLDPHADVDNVPKQMLDADKSPP